MNEILEMEVDEKEEKFNELNVNKKLDEKVDEKVNEILEMKVDK